MYTLYGKKGSGSASTQAALEIIGAPYRIVETDLGDRDEPPISMAAAKISPTACSALWRSSSVPRSSMTLTCRLPSPACPKFTIIKE